MRIFVTGATGYLGYHFVNMAVNQGHEVLCLKRLNSKSLFEPIIEKQISWVINDDVHLKDVIANFCPDVLFHAAWGGVRGKEREDCYIQSDNFKMSRAMFSLYPYKQIIAIGSQAEYGHYITTVSEEHPLNPMIEYAKSKVECCRYLRDYCDSSNIEWQWIRIFTVFGEKQTGGLIKIAIEKCLSGEKEFKTTKGEQLYSYLYAYDYAKAICQILGTKGKSGIYNLSQPLGLHSNKEVLERIKYLTHSEINYDFGAIPYPDGQVMLMDGSVAKFVQAFGQIPYTEFNKALNNTIESFKNEQY